MNSRHNWDGYSHKSLYDQIHGNGGFWQADGAGVSGAAGAQDGWAELGMLMARARERTEAALTRAGAVWEGGAADSMRSGVTPLAQWADDAHTASTASQNSTDAHVGAYSAAKNHMPEPVPVTSTANSDVLGIPAMYTHLFGGQTDQDRQEAAAQEAKAEAVRIMSGYESESGGAQASVGRFVPPPSVTVDVAPSQSTGGSVIPVGVSEWPGTGRVNDDSTRSGGDTRGPNDTPPPGGSPTPPPPGHNPVSPGTSPSDVTTTPPLTKNPPSLQPVTPGLGSDQVRSTPLVPTGGLSTFGGPGGQGTGRGPVGRGISEGGSGRVPAGTGGVRGAVPGAGGLVNETVAGRTGAAGARGGAGMGMAPAGGRSDGDEDKEHKAAEYLRDFHDSFWDDTPPVAPAVIGDEDDE